MPWCIPIYLNSLLSLAVFLNQMCDNVFGAGADLKCDMTLKIYIYIWKLTVRLDQYVLGQGALPDIFISYVCFVSRHLLYQVGDRCIVMTISEVLYI